MYIIVHLNDIWELRDDIWKLLGNVWELLNAIWELLAAIGPATPKQNFDKTATKLVQKSAAVGGP